MSESPAVGREFPVLYTIGHSTRSLDEFVGLLDTHRVTKLGDIRTVPRSRRHPHFAIEALSVSLPRAGIAYRYFPGLGGLRKPRANSPNTAWRHSGFRAYSDYMATPAFETAIDLLLEFVSASAGGGFGGPASRTAIMCAEAVWWRCHRQLVADALVARGVEVRHILSERAAPPHTLTDFARVDNGKVSYPGLIR
jgi:uncharacterized protein (DUF488 family)